MTNQNSLILLTISGQCPAPVDGHITIGPIKVKIPSHLLPLCAGGILGIQARLDGSIVIATSIKPLAAPQSRPKLVHRIHPTTEAMRRPDSPDKPY